MMQRLHDGQYVRLQLSDTCAGVLEAVALETPGPLLCSQARCQIA